MTAAVAAACPAVGCSGWRPRRFGCGADPGRACGVAPPAARPVDPALVVGWPMGRLTAGLAAAAMAAVAGVATAAPTQAAGANTAPCMA